MHHVGNESDCSSVCGTVAHSRVALLHVVNMARKDEHLSYEVVIVGVAIALQPLEECIFFDTTDNPFDQLMCCCLKPKFIQHSRRDLHHINVTKSGHFSEPCEESTQVKGQKHTERPDLGGR